MYGVIDIGSNTIRLSVYKKVNDDFKSLFNKKYVAGLAGYVNKNNKLSEEGIEKCIEVLNELSSIAKNISLNELFVFATASLRNVKKSAEVIGLIQQKTGLSIDLVSGENEGRYDFIGAMHQNEFVNGALIDIGGGSTEIVYFSNKQITSAVSLEIGSLNLYKKFVSGIVPTEEEYKKIKKYVKTVLKEVDITANPEVVCGIGGTIRNAKLICQQSSGINSSCIDINVLRMKLNDYLLRPQKTISDIIKICPERIHTIIPGILILDGIVKKMKSSSVAVSTYGIREGYLITKLFKEERYEK